MNRCFNLYETALRILCTGLLALGYNVDTFNNSTLFVNEDLQNLTCFSSILAGIHINRITFLYV